MKKIFLAAVALTALAAAPAMAADLSRPVYRAPPPPAPVYIFSWTGCYIGGHVGGLWAQKDWTVAGAPFFAAVSSFVSP